MLCLDHGVAYQADMTKRVQYDADYFNKCASYEGKEIADKINLGRINLVLTHFGSGRVVDVGVGSGEFVKRRFNTFGRDVNPVAVRWLKDTGQWAYNLSSFEAFTFWDVIEHLEDPSVYFDHIQRGAMLFTSIPIFNNLGTIRRSKHYRPGEHLYYWTHDGFVRWMKCHGFDLLEHATFEMDAGREDIHSFAFVRNHCE
jgi:hypothetical protein